MDSSENFYKRLAENMSDMVALHDPDGRYLWVSPSVERILGYSPEELVGTDPYDLFHPDDRIAIRNGTHEPAVTGDGNILIRYRIRRADGVFLWFETLTQPIENEQGDVIELHTTSRDVTRQCELEDALAASEALYRVAMESLEEGVVVFDSEGRIMAHNPRAAEILGVPGDQLEGLLSRDPRWDAVYPDGTPFPPEHHPNIVTLCTGEPCSNVLMGIYNPQKQMRSWISVNSRLLPVNGGVDAHQARVIVSFDDVTEQIERERQLQRWSTVYRFSGEAIVIADAAGTIQDANKAFERITQDEKAAWVGRQVDDITLDSPSEDLFASTIWPTLDSHGHWRGELWLRNSEGGIQTTWAAMTRVDQAYASDGHHTLILSDFSERSIREEKLQYYAGHDSLPGLPNRLLLADRFEVALNTARRRRTTFGCFYLDLDGFKPINDRFGHAAGDAVLRTISERILQVVRSEDAVSRIGGDEFFAIVSGMETEGDYWSMAMRMVRAIAETIEFEGHSFNVGVSVGIALYPRHGESQEELMEASDAAMYRAKREGLSVQVAEINT